MVTHKKIKTPLQLKEKHGTYPIPYLLNLAGENPRVQKPEVVEVLKLIREKGIDVKQIYVMKTKLRPGYLVIT